MYSVSDNYKTQINKSVRNLSYMKINFGIVEVDATEDNVISDNGHLFYSASENTYVNKAILKRYLTLEHNKFILDGKNLLPPEIGSEVSYYQGYVSDVMSDANGNFVSGQEPVLTINFGALYSFVGLTFRFNKTFNSYPSEMVITAYNGATQIYSGTHYPTSYEFIVNEHIPATDVFCDKIVITFKKTFPVRRRVELAYVMLGIVATFTESTLTNSVWTRKIDLLSASLPKNELKFTILDPLKDYNPENPSGVWQYLEERQPVYFEYGYELDDGTIEWVEGSSLFSNGEIKIDSKNALPTVTFTAESSLNSLEDMYYRGVYNPSGITLYDLAVDVLEFAKLPRLFNGMPQYVVDESLKLIKTTVPIPIIPIKEAVQLIANAGRCVVECNRYGQIVISRLDPAISDFKFDLFNIYSSPLLDKVPYLLSVETYNNNVQVSSELSELHNSDINFSTPTECLLSHDMSTNLTLNVGTGVTVVEPPQYFAGACLVTLVGRGKVTITGNVLLLSKDGVSHVVRDNGYTCPIENQLLNSVADTQAYAEWVASIIMRRSQYQIEDRGYPEIDMGDLIYADSLFTQNMSATITSSKLTFDGTLSGETTYVTKDVT